MVCGKGSLICSRGKFIAHRVDMETKMGSLGNFYIWTPMRCVSSSFKDQTRQVLASNHFNPDDGNFYFVHNSEVPSNFCPPQSLIGQCLMSYERILKDGLNAPAYTVDLENGYFNIFDPAATEFHFSIFSLQADGSIHYSLVLGNIVMANVVIDSFPFETSSYHSMCPWYACDMMIKWVEAIDWYMGTMCAGVRFHPRPFLTCLSQIYVVKYL